MASSPTPVALTLTVLGALLLLAGVVGVMTGATIPERIASLLPSEALIDAAGVGGATVALGALASVVGLLHLAPVPGVRRRSPPALITGIMLGATLAVIAAASAVAVVVSIASGSGPPEVLLPVAIGLALAAGVYVWLTAVLIGLRGGTRRPD
jgi:hypothetical protein